MKCTPFEARVEFTEATAAGNERDIRQLLERYPHIKPL